MVNIELVDRVAKLLYPKNSDDHSAEAFAIIDYAKVVATDTDVEIIGKAESALSYAISALSEDMNSRSSSEICLALLGLSGYSTVIHLINHKLHYYIKTSESASPLEVVLLTDVEEVQ